MRVNFQSIRLKRFRSYLEESVLLFDAAGPGLYFLKGKNNTALGSNGAGKSTVVDALMWCLYGRTVKGLRNTDVVPWSGKGTTEVELTVSVDGEKHKIKRTINPNLLTIDGKEAGQEYVDKLIQIPLEVLPYTIVMGQHQDLFFDLTSSEALKIFSNSLGLERWEHRAAHAAEQAKTLEAEISNKEIEGKSFDNLIARSNSELERLRSAQKEWEEKRQAALSNKEAEKKALQKQINNVLKERDTADLQLDRAETEIAALNLDKWAKDERQFTLRAEQQNTALERALEKEEELKGMLSSLKDELCPTCNQTVNQEARKKLEKNIKEQIKELRLQELTKAQAVACSERDRIQLAHSKQQEAAQTFIKMADEARAVLDRLTPKIAEWEAKIKALETIEQEYANQDNPYREQIQHARKYLQETKARQEKLEENLKSRRELCERVRYWVKAFKDIKLYTLEEILQELEITTNSMCDEFGLTGWQVEYDIERETKSGTISRGINITVRSPANKQAVKWGVWSGGEGQRLKLIGSAALSSVLLNHVGVTTNLEIYDEPTESLSREGVADLVDLLAQRAKETKKNIWLVDHHVIESSQFVDIVLVTKDKQGSHFN